MTGLAFFLLGFAGFLSPGKDSVSGPALHGDRGSEAPVSYRYLSYLPADYADAKKVYPLVIYLHGSSARGTNLNSVKVSGLPRLAEDGRKFDFILVAPQCPSGRLWSSEDWAGSLLKELNTRYRIDPDRIYLTGVSMGGGGTFDVAKRYPGTFAALAPMCAWASDTYQLCKLKNVPVWTFHGTEDHVVPISETEQKVKVLRDCGGSIKYTRLKGEGHSIHFVYDPDNEYRLLEWMLSHRRKKE